MNKRILHIVSEDKFTDYAIEQFGCLDIPSDFVLIVVSGKSHVAKRDKTMVVYRYTDAYYSLLNSLSNYSAIILHGIYWRFDYDILSKVPSDVKVAWVNTGGEIYGRYDICKNFLSRRSILMEKIHNWKKRLTEKDIYIHHYELPLEVFRRVDYCLTDEREEYEYARNYIQKLDLEYLMYNYYTLEDMIGSLIDKRSSGNHIFMGNSADNECNYWDVIPKVARLKNRGQKVIVPLSYGSPWVRNAVLPLGKLLYGKDFMPLTDFLPREQYNELICNCSTMIMPHYSPRAQGNIITALWLGMRVYLSEHNMTYHYFKRIGCTVSSIEQDLKRSNKERFTPMTDEELEHNRKILYATYSRESTMKAVQHIAETLTSDQ